MTIVFDDIGIFDEPGYTFDGESGAGVSAGVGTSEQKDLTHGESEHLARNTSDKLIRGPSEHLTHGHNSHRSRT